MVDFNGFPIVCPDYIEWLERVSTEHVLHESDSPNNRKTSLLIQIPHSRDNRSGSSHIALHVEHGIIWLNLDTTRVKRYALSNERVFGSARLLLFKNNRTRSVGRTLSYCQEHSKRFFFHIGLTQNTDIRIFKIERPDYGDQFFRIFFIGWKIY